MCRCSVDRLQFEALYARFGPSIHARCRRMLRDPSAAEDATQETFLRLYPELAGIRGPREASAWLFRTATNHCLNELRRGHRRFEVAGDAGTQGQLAAAVPTELRLVNQDLVTRLIRAIPEDLALTGWLYHVDGLEQSEIAQICKVSRRTVVARVGRFGDLAKAFIERSDP
jgi:RNA polymerase sigma-70 factor, ECF subfamily